MASVKQSSLTLKNYDGFGGKFVDSQMLGWSYDTGKPHLFDHTLMKIFSSKNDFFAMKNMIGLTGQRSVGRMEIDTNIFRWHLDDSQEKTAISLGPVDATNTAPGLNKTTFQIKLDLDFYERPDVLMGEDSRYSLAVVDKVADGLGTIYTVRIETDDPNVFFPTELLEAGKEFSKVWTSVQDEYNHEFGTQQTASSFKLESQMGAFAQAFEVTDKALRNEGRLGVDFIYTDERTGKEMKVSKFMPMWEGKMYNELYQSMDAQSVYGTKSTRPSESTGYWKKTGPGTRSQMRDSWNKPYSDYPTVDLFKDFLLDISIPRVDEGARQYSAITGTLGSMFLHDALASQAASFLTVDTHFIKEIDRSRRFLSYGAQFTHYKGPEGIEFTLLKDRMNDSLKYEKRKHPQYKNFGIDSARYTFLDFSPYKGQQNVMMLSEKDTFRHGYQIGTVGPMGPVQGGNVSIMKASYNVFVEGTRGIVIFDPTRCGEIIFDYEA
jgi:hypothetical protein